MQKTEVIVKEVKKRISIISYTNQTTNPQGGGGTKSQEQTGEPFSDFNKQEQYQQTNGAGTMQENGKNFLKVKVKNTFTNSGTKM